MIDILVCLDNIKKIREMETEVSMLQMGISKLSDKKRELVNTHNLLREVGMSMQQQLIEMKSIETNMNMTSKNKENKKILSQKMNQIVAHTNSKTKEFQSTMMEIKQAKEELSRIERDTANVKARCESTVNNSKEKLNEHKQTIVKCENEINHLTNKINQQKMQTKQMNDNHEKSVQTLWSQMDILQKSLQNYHFAMTENIDNLKNAM